jgi:hypothetical protein
VTAFGGLDLCSCKRGFFTLRDCANPAVATCKACSRRICQQHLSEPEYCVEFYEVRPVYDDETGEARSVENVPIEPAENRIQEVRPEAELGHAAGGEASGPAQYLIALDDGLIYLTDNHWLQGDTLHYVTMSGAHNMATLDRIDLDLTVRLNRERGLKFQLRKRDGER